MSPIDALVWIFGMVIAATVIIVIVAAIADTQKKIHGYKNDPTIFTERIEKEQQNDDENNPPVS